MKNILGIGIIVGSLFLWAKGKAGEISENFSQTVQQLTYRVVGIRNINWSGGLPFFGTDPKVTFDLDLEISNPSQYNWNVNGGGMVQLVKVEFLSLENKLIAIAKPQVNAINLPAQGKAVFKNIPAEISVKDASVINTFANFSKDSFKIRPTINIAGMDYTIEN